MAPLEGPLCSVCGEKLAARYFESNTGPCCTLCHRAPQPFAQAVAFGSYEGPLRDLIHVFKYQQVRSASSFFSRLLDQAARRLPLTAGTLVIPVPLYGVKRQARGFNQAEEIARAFVRFRSAAASIQLDTTSLARTRETASQTGLTRHQRRLNVRGAFRVRRPEDIRGRDVLLVDDVMTTGTTAGECARVLLRAGARRVFVATVARATREMEGALARAAGAPMGGTQGHA